MKNKLTLTMIGLATALSAPLALADATGDQQANQPAQPARDMSTQSSTKSGELRFSQIRHAKIKSSTGQDLGKLDDLVVDAKTGKIQCAVIGQGGFLGIGESLVPVPWQTVSSTTQKEITLNVDAQKFQSAPKLAKDYSNLSDPNFMAQVDQYFAIPSAVGGAETPGGMQQGTGQNPTGK
jgi:sporulation protein YlmC with PRC-barrel domain